MYLVYARCEISGETVRSKSTKFVPVCPIIIVPHLVFPWSVQLLRFFMFFVKRVTGGGGGGGGG